MFSSNASIHVIAWVIEALMGCTSSEIETKSYISFKQFEFRNNFTVFSKSVTVKRIRLEVNTCMR